MSVFEVPSELPDGHLYRIYWDGNGGIEASEYLTLAFQCGPVSEAGFNGITNEALLAILIDRLEHFQKGPHACQENGLSLRCLNEALFHLHARSRGRVMRGVEGTNQP